MVADNMIRESTDSEWDVSSDQFLTMLDDIAFPDAETIEYARKLKEREKWYAIGQAMQQHRERRTIHV